MTQPAEPEELIAAVGAPFRIRNAESAPLRLNDPLRSALRSAPASSPKRMRGSGEIVERAKAEAALVQAQKMEAIGQLTGGIAHDFNNLLHGIVGALDLIRRRMPGRTPARASSTRRSSPAQRAAALTHRLLAFSRRQPLAPQPVEVNQLVPSLRSCCGAPAASRSRWTRPRRRRRGWSNATPTSSKARC